VNALEQQQIINRTNSLKTNQQLPVVGKLIKLTKLISHITQICSKLQYHIAQYSNSYCRQTYASTHSICHAHSRQKTEQIQELSSKSLTDQWRVVLFLALCYYRESRLWLTHIRNTSDWNRHRGFNTRRTLTVQNVKQCYCQPEQIAEAVETEIDQMTSKFHNLATNSFIRYSHIIILNLSVLGRCQLSNKKAFSLYEVLLRMFTLGTGTSLTRSKSGKIGSLHKNRQ